MDAWFAGYQPTLTAITWIGYDTPRKLGDRETGGGLALPVWISFMQHALQNVPVAEISPPEGVTHEGGDWAFTEFSKGGGVSSLGMDARVPSSGNDPSPTNPAPVVDEKKKILDLFRQ